MQMTCKCSQFNSGHTFIDMKKGESNTTVIMSQSGPSERQGLRQRYLSSQDIHISSGVRRKSFQFCHDGVDDFSTRCLSVFARTYLGWY